MRGNFRWIVSSASPAGSSPLMRGKLDAELSAQVDDGLIPAYAGKTARASRARRFCRAHPHSHGENDSPDVNLSIRSGPSPLTRGKHPAEDVLVVSVRLIPTHAGKTPARPEPQASPRAHPRSRGENLPLVFLCTLWWGSSPLTRGKRRHNPATTAVVGLIPTHAGSTSWMQGSRPTCGAHPHSRGENSATSLTDEEWEGSSPLTRGKRSEECCGVHDVGLIPTDAGKTH